MTANVSIEEEENEVVVVKKRSLRLVVFVWRITFGRKKYNNALYENASSFPSLSLSPFLFFHWYYYPFGVSPHSLPVTTAIVAHSILSLFSQCKTNSIIAFQQKTTK